MRSSTILALGVSLATWFAWTSLPREWTDIIWVLTSRQYRLIVGGPAPLYCDEFSVPDVYEVVLTDGYSLEDHKQKTGRADLQNAILLVDQRSDRILGHNILYNVKTKDETLVDAIRSDVGVVFVQCKTTFGLRGWHSQEVLQG